MRGCVQFDKYTPIHTYPLTQRAQGREARKKIVESGTEAKMCKKFIKRCRRHVGNGGDLNGKRKKVGRKVSTGSVAADRNILEDNKGEGKETRKAPGA